MFSCSFPEKICLSAAFSCFYQSMKNGYRLPARLNRKIGQAMHDYRMFSAEDNVLVAVSGGIDSLVLACVMRLWQKKAPIRFNLAAYHIDHGFWRNGRGMVAPATAIGQQLLSFGMTLEITGEREISDEARTCFL
jgi:tRNA 2-thiocytidine biosynthesis protein TtcA